MILMFVANIIANIGALYYVLTKLEEYKKTGAETLDATERMYLAQVYKLKTGQIEEWVDPEEEA